MATVKDILQSSRKRSTYEMLMLEIRDLVLREKKENDEIIHVSSSSRNAGARATMKDVMYPVAEREDHFEIHDQKNDSVTGHKAFGKRINADRNGSRMKRTIYSSCSSRVDPAPPLIASSSDAVNVHEAVVESPLPVSPEMQLVKACMSYLNKIRLYLKKRDLEPSLFTLAHHFHCIDKKKGCDFDEFMQILTRVHINLDPKIFYLLLNKFGLMDKHGMVDYNETLKLLYWKCEMPRMRGDDELSFKK